MISEGERDWGVCGDGDRQEELPHIPDIQCNRAGDAGAEGIPLSPPEQGGREPSVRTYEGEGGIRH